MSRRFYCLFVCISCLFSACASEQSRGVGAARSDEAAIASALEQINSNKGDYRISPSDLLAISVYQDKDMDREVRVSQNGSISFPLVGEVSVGGHSTIEAEQILSNKLKVYLVNPQVSVFIKEYGAKSVFVLGQVAHPGAFALPTESKMTVLEAISLAGGFTPIAAPDRTRVVRKSDGKSETLSVEVSAITRGQKDKDIVLQANDIVYVPQSFF